MVKRGKSALTFSSLAIICAVKTTVFNKTRFTRLVLFVSLLVLSSITNTKAHVAAEDVPSITIGQDHEGNHVKVPLVGAGTWQYNDTLAYQSICKAFEAGYTFVDTAFGYNNQIGVGMAIKDCWQRSREELFLLTKVPGGLSRKETTALHHQNLWELQLEYVDHLMVHFPSDWKQQHTGKEQRQEQWKALEDIYHTGQAKTIGISHYCPQHIDDILEIATVKPSLNQVEYHVGSQDVDGVIDKCTQEGITFMSFSPLCGPCQYDAKDSLITGDLVTDIARHYPNKTGSQISLRFIVQQSLVGTLPRKNPKIGPVIPKSNNAKHIASNVELFDFALSDDDMERLKAATKPEAETGDCDVP